MTDFSPDPSWLRRLNAAVLRLGPVRATVLTTLLVYALSVAVSLGFVVLSGRGDPLVAFWAASLCALGLTPPIGGLLIQLVFRLDAARRRLALLAAQDDLTGLHNRRHFLAVAEREWARCRRYGTDGALLLIDADHFKAINGSHGHACGDGLLREIARVVAQSLRQPDLLARFGGEALIVFLPHTDPLGALDVAERIRVQVGDLRLDWQGQAVGTSVSIGVASLGGGHASLDALVHDADAALHAAKEAGRNCVRSAPLRPRGQPASGPPVGDRRRAGPV